MTSAIATGAGDPDDRDRYERILRVFLAVKEAKPEDRDRLLRELCAGDEEIQAAVEHFLDRDEEASIFLERPAFDVSFEAPTEIGPYEVGPPLGRGGMGEVFEGRQRVPFERDVAIKIIRHGGSDEIMGRFTVEQQTVAMMDHPNIARIYDAGVTPAGQPYFVMERVHGAPLLEYCATKRLDVRTRLEIFRQVCLAVQHAHQKGIIHRDLKPSNVLVAEHDGVAVPKVIDFGIAKAVHPEILPGSIRTEEQRLIGTPAYMSPEQADGRNADVDTRSDIYALGGILYELLTSTTPFDARALATRIADMMRIIREETPPTPSTRLSSLDVERGSLGIDYGLRDTTQLAERVRGDLDWIVMKCLEKEPERRYASANGLASDIDRYLRDEPVSATPPSAGYRLRKFVRRHRAAVLAAGSIAAVLIIATAVSVVFAISAERARSESEQRATELQDVSDFQTKQLLRLDATEMGRTLHELVLAKTRAAWDRQGLVERELEARTAELESLLEATPLTDVARDVLDDQIFAPTLLAIDEQFMDQPLVRARLMQALAEVMTKVGLIDQAVAAQTEALAINRDELGDRDARTIESINNLGYLLLESGRLDEAEALLREALDAAKDVMGPDHAYTLRSVNNMGLLFQQRGDLASAEPYYREAYSIKRRTLGDDDPSTLLAMNNVGGLLWQQGKPDEAEPIWREAMERCRRVLGEDDELTLKVVSNVGVVLRDLDRLEEAAPFCVEAVDGRRRVLGSEHPETLVSLHNSSDVLAQLGSLDEAERLASEAVDNGRKAYPAGHPYVGVFLTGHAKRLAALDRYDDAEQRALEAHAILAAVFPPGHERRVSVAQVLFELYDAWDEAEPGKGYGERARAWRERSIDG